LIGEIKRSGWNEGNNQLSYDFNFYPIKRHIEEKNGVEKSPLQKEKEAEEEWG